MKKFQSKSMTLQVREKSCYWEKISQITAFVFLTIFPLIPGFNGYYNITETKYTWFWIFVLCYVIFCSLVILGFALEPKMLKLRKEDGRQSLSLPQIAIIGYVAASVISGICSSYGKIWEGQSRYEGLCAIICYSALFFGLSFWCEYLEKIIIGASATALVTSIIGILQTIGIDFLSPKEGGYSTYHFVANIGNVDMVSGYVALLIPFLIGAYIVLEGKWRYQIIVPAVILLTFLQSYIDVDSGKIGLGFSFLIMLPFVLDEKKKAKRFCEAISMVAFGLFLEHLFIITGENEVYSCKVSFTKTTAALLLATIVCLIASRIITRGKEEWKWSPKKIRIVVTIVIVAAILIGLIWLYNYDGDIQLISEASGVLHGDLPDKAGSHRGYLWKSSFKLALEKPWFGHGPGSFIAAFMPYSEAYYNTSETKMAADMAHNDFLQIAVNEGCIALLFYVIFIIALLIRFIKAEPKNPYVIIFAAGAAGYLAHSFFSFSIAIITPLFWVVAGMLEKCIRQTPKGE